MTFQSDELSVASGQPVELFRFRLRDTTTYWRYTSAGYDIVYDGETYTATPGISRSKFEENDDVLKTELRVTLPSNHTFSNLFMFYIPDGIIDITVFRGHGTNFVQYWDGIVRTVYAIESSEVASVICGPHTDAVQAPFIIRTYERLCDVPLYGTACGLDPETFKVTVTPSYVSGLTIVSNDLAAYGSDYFTGGYIIADGFKRKIKSHTTSTLVLVSVAPGLEALTSISVYPGCDHLRATCISKFDNLFEYRGCDWIPDDEPFSSEVLGTTGTPRLA